MKKLITALAMTVLLTACGSDYAQTTQQATTAPIEVKADVTPKGEPILLTVGQQSLTDTDFQDFMSLELSVKNTADKELTGIKGRIIYLDKFGDQIISLDISDDQIDLPAGQTFTATYDWEYNEFINEHNRFINGDLNDMTYKFQADTILFADGTTL